MSGFQGAYTPMSPSDKPWLQPRPCSGADGCEATGTHLYAAGWRCEAHPPVTSTPGLQFTPGAGELPERATPEPVIQPPKVRIPAPRIPEPDYEMELTLF